MDFENEIEPLVVRNNNQVSDITSSFSLTLETRVSEVINLSSSEDDEQRTIPNSEGSVKYATNNNVIIPITRQSFDIKNCYEFIGLIKESSDESDVAEKTVDESKDTDDTKHAAPATDLICSPKSSNVPSPCDTVTQIDTSKKELINNNNRGNTICLKVKLIKQKLRQQKSKLKRKKEYEELRRCKEKLRELLPRHLSTCKLDTGTLVGAITKYCHQLQQEVSLAS